MSKRGLLIILFVLVSAGCALLGSKQIGAQSDGVPAVVTESCIDIYIDECKREEVDCKICRKHDPKTGLVDSVYYKKGEKVFEGVKADGWICEKEITDDSDPRTRQDCREFMTSSELFGYGNPGYSSGGWGWSFWPD